MKGKMNKKLVILIATILVIGSSTVFAADNLTTLKGWFADIKIFSNGNQVQLDTKPLVINNTTYIPVRALTNVLNKEIEWKQDTFSIYINDKPDANYNYVMMQLFEKQDQITKLEAKVKELEAQLAEAKTSKPTTLSELQKYLNSEFGIYENIDFEVAVSGSASKITVKIYVDKGDNTRWKNLSSTKIKNYVQDIVDDVEYYFPKASITGYIVNDYNNRTEVDFYVNSSGKLVIDTDYSGGTGSIYGLEDDLKNEFDYYSGVSFSITAWENGYDIELEIDVDYDKWFNYLDSYERKEYLESIYDYIMTYYDYKDVYGNIYDYNEKLGSFTFYSSGAVNLRNY